MSWTSESGPGVSSSRQARVSNQQESCQESERAEDAKNSLMSFEIYFAFESGNILYSFDHFSCTGWMSYNLERLAV